MTGSPVDIYLFAPLAPILCMILFWFLQLVFIESQKHLLVTISENHQPFFRLTNFIGIFFQAICQALGYTIARSGVSHFEVSVTEETVTPRQEKKGSREWLAKAILFIGPFFLPAALLLICLFFLMGNGFVFTSLTDYTFSDNLQAFGKNFLNFAENLFSFLASLDFFNPFHAGFFVLLVFFGLGIRPSSTGEGKRDKITFKHDLDNIKSLIFEKPLFILLLVFAAYIFYYITFFFQFSWYLNVFTVFTWLSFLAIVALVITHLIILLIRSTDEIQGRKKIIPYLTLPLSYITTRIVLFAFNVQDTQARPASLGVMILLTVVVIIILLLKNRTNRFKTKKMMKPRRVKDGPRRTAQQ